MAALKAWCHWLSQLHSLALKDANFEPQSKDLTSRIMVAVSPVIKDNQMGSKNRQKLVHSAAHFLGTLTGTVRPPSIWKLKEFTELYACLNHLKLEPNDHRQEQIDCRIKTGLQSSHHLALYHTARWNTIFSHIYLLER